MLFTDDNFNFRSIKESDMPFETFLQAYFFEMRSKPLENDELSLSFKSLIFDDTHIYIEKIKTIALLLNNIENNRYKPILEIAIFNRDAMSEMPVNRKSGAHFRKIAMCASYFLHL